MSDLVAAELLKLRTTRTTWVLLAATVAVSGLAVANLSYRLAGYTFPLDSSDAWYTLAGAVLYAALFGALGAATGSLVRNQVAAIVGWLAWLFVVEHIAVGFLPSLGRWLPAAAGRALVRAPNEELLAQSTAAVVLAVYAAAMMSIAVFSERYRDA